MKKIIFCIVALFIGLSVNAQEQFADCSLNEKTFISDNQQLDQEESLLVEALRMEHELSIDASVKVLTSNLSCNDTSGHGYFNNHAAGNKDTPMCKDVGCVTTFPSTANRITFYYCESNVKTTIKYKRLPDGKYEIVEVKQELVTTCTLEPEGGNGPE